MRARRLRRRRTLLMIAAATVVVVATVGGTAMMVTPVGDSRDDVAPADTLPSDPLTRGGEVAADNELEGTWTVRALVGENGRSVLPASAPGTVWLTFADGEMTGSDGCNSKGGTYVQSGDEGRDLRFEQLWTTDAYCPDAPPLGSRLADVRHVSGSAGVRYLHAENWMNIAELRVSDSTR